MAVFVLVHGAGTGGWLWRRVRDLLRRAGHDVFTPTLTGLGERAHLARRDICLATHIDDVVAVLEEEELSDVVVVGYNYSGMIIPAVADRLPARVRRLVYLDAVFADSGQSMLDIMPPDARETWQRLVLAGDGWRVPPTEWTTFGAVEDDGCDEAEIRRLLARRVPTPLACYAEPLTLRGAEAPPPATYVYCAAGIYCRVFHQAAERMRARGCDVRELPTGHFCMLTMPRATARLLEEVAAS